MPTRKMMSPGSGSDRFASPNYAPVAQDYAAFGAGVGDAIQSRQGRAQKANTDAVLRHVFGRAKGPSGLPKAMQNDSSSSHDAALGNLTRLMAVNPPK